jgi:hypothetical protein
MQTIKLPTQRLQAHFAAAEANRDERIIPVTFYTGAEVLQFSWERGEYNLTLSLEPGHVRLGRFKSGRAPFTRGHASANDPLATLGVITNPRIENSKAKADVRFSKRADVDPIFADVLDGILPNVSVGANLYKLKETTQEKDERKSFLATDWEPTAVALVGIGGDPGAHFADAEQNVECEIEFAATAAGGLTMEKETTGATGAETTDAPKIRNLVELMHLEPAFGDKLITQGVTLDSARSAVINETARRANIIPEIRTAHAEITRDSRGGLVERLSEALACRYSAKPPSDAAREFIGAPISEFARECLRIAGMRVPRQPAEIIRLGMHGTSDFPNLLTGTGQRLLLDAYNAASPAIKQVARRSTVNDFRTKAVLRLGEAPTLVKVPETGEVTHGTRAEMKESYRAFTYGRIFSISREALVNDDLSAFADFARAFGVAAAQLEGTLLVDLLASNPVMSDGKQLFDATYHHNLVTPGTAISVDNLSIARTMTRLQTGLDGTTVLDIPPRYLVVPATKETLAEAYLTSIQAATAADVNPFPGKLTLVVDGHLDAKSVTAWYLFGDPNLTPVLEYSYLAGSEGVQVDSRAGWEQLGQEFRAVLDYGVGILDHRGALLNLGA